MIITKNKVVSISYMLRQDRENGEIVEQVTTDNPLTFLFGVGGMLPKFEQNLDGMSTGDEFKFGLLSEDAYGPVVENAIVEVPLQVFTVDGVVDNTMLQIGNVIPMMDNAGNRLNGKVLSVGKEAVKMDFNHPMAGRDLFFEGKITEVREATDEELTHGHVHSGCGCEGGSCDNDHANGNGCGCSH